MHWINYLAEIERYGFPDQLARELVKLFETRNGQPARKRHTDTLVAHNTRYRRFVNLCASLRDLAEIGYPIQSIYNLKERHIEALVRCWQSKRQGVGTVENKLSYLRTLCRWIGKPNMVRGGATYSEHPEAFRRPAAATRDKSWEGNGIDPLEVIERVRSYDEVVGMQLELMFLYGMRRKEACLLRPRVALRQALTTGKILVEHGTKGGRPREVYVDTIVQIEVLGRASELVQSPAGTMIPPSRTLDSWLNRFEHVCGRRARLTKKERNTTAHGARHSYCQRKFSEITGKPAPIQGGGDYDPELLEQALRTVVEAAGHSRVAKSQAYLGAVLTRRKRGGRDGHVIGVERK